MGLSPLEPGGEDETLFRSRFDGAHRTLQKRRDVIGKTVAAAATNRSATAIIIAWRITARLTLGRRAARLTVLARLSCHNRAALGRRIDGTGTPDMSPLSIPASLPLSPSVALTAWSALSAAVTDPVVRPLLLRAWFSRPGLWRPRDQIGLGLHSGSWWYNIAQSASLPCVQNLAPDGRLLLARRPSWTRRAMLRWPAFALATTTMRHRTFAAPAHTWPARNRTRRTRRSPAPALLLASVRIVLLSRGIAAPGGGFPDHLLDVLQLPQVERRDQ